MSSEWNKCPGCGISGSSFADYCPNCGEPWTIECQNCGKTWRFWEDYRFCPNCGVQVEKRGVSRGPRQEIQVGRPTASYMAEKKGMMPKAGAEKKGEVPVEEEIPDLEGKLLAVIGDYPNGITLAEISERWRVASVVLGRTARKLIDRGLVRREERLFFPVVGE